MMILANKKNKNLQPSLAHSSVLLPSCEPIPVQLVPVQPVHTGSGSTDSGESIVGSVHGNPVIFLIRSSMLFSKFELCLPKLVLFFAILGLFWGHPGCLFGPGGLFVLPILLM